MTERYAQEWLSIVNDLTMMDFEVAALHRRIARKVDELRHVTVKIQSNLLCTMSHWGYMRMLREAGLL